jgi:2-dehydro-3-deoxy-D-arabinonate dehydratase
MISLVRFTDAEGSARVGVNLDGRVHDVTSNVGSVAEWLRSSSGRVPEAIEDLRRAAEESEAGYDFTALLNSQDGLRLLAPVDEQDVWAAGVTYERSRQGRQEEAADGGDVYARVYTAERPELFFKARGGWVVGPRGEVGIRRDATWNVPEPELTLVFNPALEPVGVTIGNDMSSRDIEGANPLYLPQAKVYTGSCALGPQIVLSPSRDWPDAEIRLTVERHGATAVHDSVSTRRIRRTITELADYLGRCIAFPDGTFLMTGTGVVPASDFTLQPGDLVTISIDGIGDLRNRVAVV